MIYIIANYKIKSVAVYLFEKQEVSRHRTKLAV